MAKSKSTNDAPIYQIKVTLEDSKPPISLRLLVRSNVTLLLHDRPSCRVPMAPDCKYTTSQMDGQRECSSTGSRACPTTMKRVGYS
jgi:hypothetical protein